ncbi:MAG: hypothetical protein HW406_1172 [Candidatus Brocadiaceae bacterium]|nr:hypothetical protein [Candidatus Brocadiaceae bacterium]
MTYHKRVFYEAGVRTPEWQLAICLPKRPSKEWEITLVNLYYHEPCTFYFVAFCDIFRSITSAGAGLQNKYP